MTAGVDESWWHIEGIDVDSDGEIDLVRIHLVNLINGDTMVTAYFFAGRFNLYQGV